MATAMRCITVAGAAVLLALSASAQTAARPDLRVNTLYLAKWSAPPVTQYEAIPPTVLSGTKVFLVCEVANGGPGKVVGNYVVSFRIDGTEVGSQVIQNAPDPGLLRKPGTAWTAGKIGSHTYQCVLDPFPSTLPETNETNNSASLGITVGIRPISVPVTKQ